MNGPKPKDWHDDQIINHETGKPESRTEYLLDEYYRENESDLPDIPETEAQRLERAFYDELGRYE